MSGRKERIDRLTQPKIGGWGTISQDFLFLTGKLYSSSAKEASSSPDKNFSRFVYAGLPLLLAAVQSFATEYEGMLNLQPLSEELSAPHGLAVLLESRYGVSGALLEDLRDLVEIRNEIVHPVPLPPGTPDNWPGYLKRVKQKGLLSTTGDPNSDYIMFSQIASHKLFVWAVGVTKSLYAAIVDSNPAKQQMFQEFLDGNFDALFKLRIGRLPLFAFWGKLRTIPSREWDSKSGDTGEGKREAGREKESRGRGESRGGRPEWPLWRNFCRI